MKENPFLMLQQVQERQALQQILACNEITAGFGLELTEQQALCLLQERRAALQATGRVEFGESILPKLTVAFCSSPYIQKEQYLPTLEALQEVFYLFKNESLEEWGDDELIALMQKHFNGACQGSVDFLAETCLTELAREVRYFGTEVWEGYDE